VKKVRKIASCHGACEHTISTLSREYRSARRLRQGQDFDVDESPSVLLCYAWSAMSVSQSNREGRKTPGPEKDLNPDRVDVSVAPGSAGASEAPAKTPDQRSDEELLADYRNGD